MTLSIEVMRDNIFFGARSVWNEQIPTSPVWKRFKEQSAPDRDGPETTDIRKVTKADGTVVERKFQFLKTDTAHYSGLPIGELEDIYEDVKFINEQFVNKVENRRGGSANNLIKDKKQVQKDFEVVESFFEDLIARKNNLQNVGRDDEERETCGPSVKKWIAASLVALVLGVAAIAAAIFLFPGSFVIVPVLIGVGVLWSFIFGISVALVRRAHNRPPA